MFQKAKWIWDREATGKNVTRNFRHNFALKALPATATLHITAHHFYKVFLNGQRLSGIAAPAPAQYPMNKWYLTYDVTELLHQGENTLAAEVLYMGVDGQSQVKGSPGVIFQLTCDDITVVSSGPDTKVMDASGYVPHLPMRESRLLTPSTHLIAKNRDRNWMNTDFDDSQWNPAILSTVGLEGVTLRPQEIPEGQISSEITPVKIRDLVGGALYDCGELLTGFVRVNVKAEPNTTLTLRYSECLDGRRNHYEPPYDIADAENVRIEHAVSNDASEFYMDQITLEGGKEEHWEEDFNYRAFRFFELTGMDENTEIIDLIACKAHTALSLVGSLSSENAYLNQLAAACYRTQLNALEGTLVDCPHREQAQYLGDSLMQSHLLTYNFSDAQPMLRKVLQDFADGQLADGGFPFVCPGSWADSTYQLRIVEYDYDFIEILWTLYWNWNDLDAVRSFYPVAAKMLAYQLGRRDETGLIPHDKTIFHVPDWPYPTVDFDGDYLFLENAKLIRAASLMATLCPLLDKKEDVVLWNRVETDQRERVRRVFFDQAKGLYADTSSSSKYHIGQNAYAAANDLFNEEEIPAVTDYFLKNDPDASVILSYTLYDFLCKHGHKATVYGWLTAPTVRWGNMMAQKSRTIWEGFSDIESRSHAWNCYPVRLLQEHFLGISSSSQCFSTVKIQPFCPAEVTTLSGSVSTSYGLIHAEMKRFEDEITYEITLPEGITGVLIWQEQTIPLHSGQQRLTL